MTSINKCKGKLIDAANRPRMNSGIRESPFGNSSRKNILGNNNSNNNWVGIYKPPDSRKLAHTSNPSTQVRRQRQKEVCEFETRPVHPVRVTQ